MILKNLFHLFLQSNMDSTTTFKLDNGPMGDNCMAQLATVHPLVASEKNVSSLTFHNQQIQLTALYFHSFKRINMKWICKSCVTVKAFMRRWRSPWNVRLSVQSVVCHVYHPGLSCVFCLQPQNLCGLLVNLNFSTYYLSNSSFYWLRNFYFVIVTLIWMFYRDVMSLSTFRTFWEALNFLKNSQIHMQSLPSTIIFKCR